jgi:hypothetical protein
MLSCIPILLRSVRLEIELENTGNKGKGKEPGTQKA